MTPSGETRALVLRAGTNFNLISFAICTFAKHIRLLTKSTQFSSVTIKTNFLYTAVVVIFRVLWQGLTLSDTRLVIKWSSV